MNEGMLEVILVIFGSPTILFLLLVQKLKAAKTEIEERTEDYD